MYYYYYVLAYVLILHVKSTLKSQSTFASLFWIPNNELELDIFTRKFNPLKRSGVRWLHFEVFSAIHV